MKGERFINIRKLAAFDIYYRNASVVLVEFGFGVFGIGALGFFAIFEGLAKSLLAATIGAYLLLLATDYAPLLIYAVLIARNSSPREELEVELANEVYFRRKYGIQQVLLMVPLVIPVLAIFQEMRGTNTSKRSK